MTKNIKRIFRASAILFAGSFLLWNCEADADDLGSQFFVGNTASGITKSYDVVAYNIDNNDSVRSDGTKISYGVLGAFNEEQFGMQKASYIAQPRLATYAPSFGTNAKVDSVVLEIKPTYVSDSAVTTTDENYTYSSDNVASKKVVVTYPISKYGKAKKSMTLNVYEVNDFLGGESEIKYSNQSVNQGQLIGSQTLTGNVSSVTITKNEDSSTLLQKDAAIRIPLSTSFFQSKIIDKQGASEIGDASNFIRYFKGVKIAVNENDGYLFRFTPSDTKITVYYTDEDSNSDSLEILLGSSNARFTQVEYDRAGSSLATALASSNYNTGDSKIYLQGMGGPSFGVRIPNSAIEELQKLYKEDKAAIVSANIRLYSDASVWNNSYSKSMGLTAGYYTPSTKDKDLSAFLTDYSAFSSLTYMLVKGYNLTNNPAYYDISITQTVKGLVESATENKDLIFTIGSYETKTSSSATNYIGSKYTTVAYDPLRMVLVGTDATNDNRAKLNIVYTKK